jgi:hypothetical protein
MKIVQPYNGCITNFIFFCETSFIYLCDYRLLECMHDYWLLDYWLGGSSSPY